MIFFYLNSQSSEAYTRIFLDSPRFHFEFLFAPFCFLQVNIQMYVYFLILQQLYINKYIYPRLKKCKSILNKNSDTILRNIMSLKMLSSSSLLMQIHFYFYITKESKSYRHYSKLFSNQDFKLSNSVIIMCFFRVPHPVVQHSESSVFICFCTMPIHSKTRLVN